MSQVEPESVPATPEQPQHFGGNQEGQGLGRDFEGRQSGGNLDQQADAVAQQRALQRAALGQRTSSIIRTLNLPTAEDIDALCDMDLPPGSPVPIETLKHLPPIATSSSSNAHDSCGQLVPSSGTQNSVRPESYIPQHGNLNFKLGRGSHSRQYDLPESCVNAGSFRMPSECSSSAYDEGTSSGLVHSVSHEERIMQDLLEERNDDMYFQNYDVPIQDNADVGNDSSKIMNSSDLQGILGQHGYKLPLSMGPQEDEGVSDRDADGDDEDDADDDSDDGDLDAADSFDVSSDAVLKVSHLMRCLMCSTSLKVMQ